MNVTQAIAAGYTREVLASYGDYELRILVKPDVDFDTRFPAFDMDELELLWINGSIGLFEDVPTHEATQSMFLASSANYLDIIGAATGAGEQS